MQSMQQFIKTVFTGMAKLAVPLSARVKVKVEQLERLPVLTTWYDSRTS